MSRKSAVVTGASGLIGRRLCLLLQRQGWHVIAMTRAATSGPWDEVIQADLTQDKALTIPASVAVIFHLAGKAHALAETSQDEAEYFAVNTDGTKRILQAAQKVGIRRFVLFSSVKAMGEGGRVEQDETAECHPADPYGRSKLAAEKLVLEGGYVPEPVVLRLSMVYGLPGKGNLPRMIEAIGKGRFPPLPDVANKRSMVHVEDVLQAALLAAEKLEAVGKIYIVTDGQYYSTRQIYVWICQALRKSVPSWRVPLWTLRCLACVGDMIGTFRGRRFAFDSDALEKLIGSAAFSSAKLREELGFCPSKNLKQNLQNSSVMNEMQKS